MHTRCSGIPLFAVTQSRLPRSFWTLMRQIYPCMATNLRSSFMGITITTAIFRCTVSAGDFHLWLTCDRARSMARSTRLRSLNCWLTSSDRIGHPFRLSSAVIAIFCRQLLLNWCDRNGVDYIVGIARNPRLEALVEPLWGMVKQHHAQRKAHGESGSIKAFWRYRYQAKSWRYARDVIAKAELTDKGTNPRFVVTSLHGNDRSLYYDVYCARGDMENRIKDQQLDLFAKRTSSKHWWSNQWRLMLSMLAFVLLEHLRNFCTKRYKNLSVESLRSRLINIAAVVTRNTRRIRFFMTENCPDQREFIQLAQKLISPG